MYQLTANKTKMVKLLKSKGYSPPRKSEFTKAFRDRTWWLEWGDETGWYSATLSTAAGRAFLGITSQGIDESKEKWTAFTLSLNELKDYELVETIQPAPAPAYSPEL